MLLTTAGLHQDFNDLPPTGLTVGGLVDICGDAKEIRALCSGSCQKPSGRCHDFFISSHRKLVQNPRQSSITGLKSLTN